MHAVTVADLAIEHAQQRFVHEDGRLQHAVLGTAQARHGHATQLRIQQREQLIAGGDVLLLAPAAQQAGDILAFGGRRCRVKRHVGRVRASQQASSLQYRRSPTAWGGGAAVRSVTAAPAPGYFSRLARFSRRVSSRVERSFNALPPLPTSQDTSSSMKPVRLRSWSGSGGRMCAK